jgi:GT2 family glycosyltransferase
MPPQKNSARVLVGISTINRADILPKSIRSAFAQSYPAVKVAVVDDGSTDGTPAVAQGFPQVEWTRWNPNRGYVAARNFMMLGAQADYFVSLDDDAWFLQGDEIAIAVDILDRDPSIAAIAYDILSPDRPQAVQRGAAVATAMFIGCGHVLRLDAVRRLNGYASFPAFYGGEEKDLCLRLLDKGYQLVKLPGVHVWHEKAMTARDLVAQHRSGVCNDLTIAMRRTPLILLPFTMAWKFIRHFQFAWKEGLLATYLEAVRAFFGCLSVVWRGRRAVRVRTLWLAARLNRG